MPKWNVRALETRKRWGVFNEIEAPTVEEAERLVLNELVQPDEIEVLECTVEIEWVEETVTW